MTETFQEKAARWIEEVKDSPEGLAMVADYKFYLASLTAEQLAAFFADEKDWSAEDQKRYKSFQRTAEFRLASKNSSDYSLAVAKFKYQRAVRLGLNISIPIDPGNFSDPEFESNSEDFNALARLIHQKPES
jgi:hypothetical protein